MRDYTKLTNLEVDKLYTENIAAETFDIPGVPQVLEFDQIKYSAGSTATKIGTVPAGYTVLKTWVNVTTAFNSGTSDTIKIGTATDDDALIGTSDITTHTAGTYSKSNILACESATDIKAVLTKTGDAATAGVADVYVMIAEI